MSKATHLLGATVALLAVSPAAAQSSAPEPPRVPPAAAQPVGTQTPPPEKKQADAVIGTLEQVQRGQSALANAGALANHSSNPSLTVRRDMRMFNGYLDAAGKKLEFLSAGQTVVEMGGEMSQGNFADAARIGAAAVVDKCIDVAVNAGCRAAALTYTAPASVYTAPMCVAAVTTVKEVCDSKLKEYTGKTMSEWVVHGAEATGDAVSDGYRAIRDRMENGFARARGDADDRMAMITTANERAERENFARQQAAQQAAFHAEASRHDAILFNNMIHNMGAAMRSPVPMTPVTGPGGCHPGHDETAHPGGCHSPRGGTAN